MRSAVVLISMLVAVVAEAPYNLPRPAPNAPFINYQRPQPGPQFVQQSSSQNQYNTIGYSYPAPVPQPIIVQQPQQVYQPISRPVIQQQSVLPQLAPQPLPQLPIISQPSQSYGVPQFQSIRPLPALISQPQPLAPQPQPVFQQVIASQPQQINFQPQPIAPQPLPAYQPQPQPQPQLQLQPQLQPQPQPQLISPPSTSYGVPQLIQTLPAIVSQSQSQIQNQLQTSPIQYQNQQISSGYSYQQPAPAQLQSSALSSYQADSNQYNNVQQAQVHRDALDDVVVSRVQDIIRDNEHSSAKEAGYLSLVSGVSLENAKPSVEILSFVHNSPLYPRRCQNSGRCQSQQASAISQSLSSSSSSSSSLLSVSRPSSEYGPPSSNNLQSNVESSGSLSSSSFGFLPQNKPAPEYGVPN